MYYKSDMHIGVANLFSARGSNYKTCYALVFILNKFIAKIKRKVMASFYVIVLHCTFLRGFPQKMSSLNKCVINPISSILSVHCLITKGSFT